MAAIKFSKQGIEPNPQEVDYWVDITANPYGGNIKYFNGTDWVDLTSGEGGNIDLNRYYTKNEINTMLSKKASVESVESKVDDKELDDLINKIEFRRLGSDELQLVLFKYDGATVALTIPAATNNNSGIITATTFKDLVKQHQLLELYSEMYDKLAELRKYVDGVIEKADNAATMAIDAAELATEVAEHPTYVGEDNYVYIWDATAKSYTKTSVYVRGEGFSISKVYGSIDEMNADTNHGLKEGDFVLINSGNVEDPDNAQLYTVTSTGKFKFVVDMSGAIGFTGKTPQLSIGTVNAGNGINDAAVALVSTGLDSEANPTYDLNFIIPRLAYNDLTEDNIAELQRPANDMIAVLEQTNETIKAEELLRVQEEHNRVSAEQGRVLTEITRVEQETERIEAEQNREDAESVRTSNENTRVTNELNRVLTEQSRETAETTRKENESIRIENENKRVDTEIIRNSSEESRQSSEASRVIEEAKRVEAESVRNETELQRQLDERTRNTAESERDDAEQIRIANETIRIENESTRQLNEAHRSDAEDIREANESERISNESIREENESHRSTSETTRNENELLRETNELVRKTNESNRIASETNRVAAETVREQNEATRITNETERKESETERIASEESRIIAESERALAETKRTNTFALLYTDMTNATNYALNVAEHPTYIGEDMYVYTWNYDTNEYIKTNIYVKGDQGIQGEQGIQGIQGIQGEKGDAFSIYKTYPSIIAMNDDVANVPEGLFVLIASNTEDIDNSKLYVKTSTNFSYLTDMSGSQGIKGEQGIQGIQGEQGILGIQGEKGDKGDIGETGKTPQLEVGTVTTLDPDESASAEITQVGTTASGDPLYQINLGIPQGIKGINGEGVGNVLVDETPLLADKTYLFKPDKDGTAEGSFVEYEIPTVEIPTKVSLLENDVPYLVEHQDISHLLSKDDADNTYQLIGDYATKSDVTVAIDDALTWYEGE